MKIPEEANQKGDMKGENLQMTTQDSEDIRDVELLLVETRLLLCRQIVNQIRMSTECSLKVAEDKSSKVDSSKDDKDEDEIVNNLPEEEEIHNKFETENINMVAMNVCGLQGKEKVVETILNKFDVRMCIMTETWLVGKEKPDVGRGYRAFHSNRSEKANRGGIAVVLEASLAEDTVVIGRSQKGEDLESIASELRWLCLEYMVVSRAKIQ